MLKAAMLTGISKLFSRATERAAKAHVSEERGIFLTVDDDPVAAVAQDLAASVDPTASATTPTPRVFDAAKLDELKSVMDQAKFSELIGQFAQSLEERINRLQRLLDQTNWTDAAREAHDIVSVAGNIGAERLSSLARGLEKSCKAKNDDGCRTLSTAFTHEAADALRALKTYQAAA